MAMPTQSRERTVGVKDAKLLTVSHRIQKGQDSKSEHSSTQHLLETSETGRSLQEIQTPQIFSCLLK